MKNCNELFAQLVQRLRSYEEASVLWILLKGSADVREYKESINQLASLELCDFMNRWAVSRSLQRLQEVGLIVVKTPTKSRSLITVDREAVLALLSQPLPERLPACSKKTFPFLDAWNAQLQAQAEIDDQKFE